MCGLDRCSTFNKVIDDLTLHLQSGDCCIFLEPLVQKLKLLYMQRVERSKLNSLQAKTAKS